VIPLSGKNHIQSEQLDTQTNFYSSFEEWQSKTFPKLAQKGKRKLIEKKPEFLGKLAGNEIMKEIHSELLNRA
jgi:hypothetical protein